jgi:hypothetical protein
MYYVAYDVVLCMNIVDINDEVNLLLLNFHYSYQLFIIRLLNMYVMSILLPIVIKLVQLEHHR